MKRVKLSKLKQLKLLASELLEERKSHDVVWKDIADHILPYSPVFLDERDDRNDGKRKGQLIMNNVATMAANTLQAGMMSVLRPRHGHGLNWVPRFLLIKKYLRKVRSG